MVTEITDNARIIIDNIMTRTSIRSYLEKPVEEFKVELILRAAMAAPSAKNLQPWSFVVVRNKQLMNALAEALPYAKMLPKADVAIVVCGDLSKSLPIEGYSEAGARDSGTGVVRPSGWDNSSEYYSVGVSGKGLCTERQMGRIKNSL